MFSPPLDVALGESYAYGDYDIEGDFESAFRLADYLIDHECKFADRVNIASRVARMRSRLRLRTDSLQASLHGRKHSESRDRLAVTHHYNLSNEFFAFWLDRWQASSGSQVLWLGIVADETAQMGFR